MLLKYNYLINLINKKSKKFKIIKLSKLYNEKFKYFLLFFIKRGCLNLDNFEMLIDYIETKGSNYNLKIFGYKKPTTEIKLKLFNEYD